MRHQQYEEFFQSIAQKHVELAHSDREMHFATVHLTRNIMGGYDLSQYFQAIRSRIRTPFMLLQTYRFGYENQLADNTKKIIQAGFVIADVVKAHDYEDRKKTWDRCERIGEECLGYIFEHIRAEIPEVKFVRRNSAEGELIGPFDDNFYGARFDLTIEPNANKNIHFNPDQFVNYG